MTHLAEEVNVVHHQLRCDQCGFEIQFDLPDKGTSALDAAGWLAFVHPVTGADVHFHTARCAKGFFRSEVESAYAGMKERRGKADITVDVSDEPVDEPDEPQDPADSETTALSWAEQQDVEGAGRPEPAAG